MTYVFKFKSLALVLCLLCSVCITPVMASNSRLNVVEDGVHLLKFTETPAQLDPQFYQNMLIGEDFVVDGDQFYWVRIGSVSAQALSTNKLALLACKGTLLIGACVAGGVLVHVAGTGEVATTGVGTPWIVPALYGALTGVVAFYADTVAGLCPVVEKWFVNTNFRAVAPDGTILLGIKKDNTAAINELKTVGIDIGRLTHLSKDGNVAHRADL